MSWINELIEGEYGWTLIFAIVIISTIITTIFYYTRDKYEPEPFSRILIAYLYGLLSVIPALIISVLIIDLFGIGAVAAAVIIAPVVEEFAKGWFVVRLSKHENFDGPLDGLIYGAMVGAGFASIENLLYGFSATYTNIYLGVELTFYRSLVQIVGHPLYTGVLGAGVGYFKVGIAKNQYNRIWQSILLHGLWNGAASTSTSLLFFSGILLVVIISIIRLRKELTDAIDLDRKAYESGYYKQKDIYLQYMKDQETQWNPSNGNFR